MYLGATAGMRLLDDPARQPIFDAIKERILKSPFAYGTAGTLSGEEEALFGNHKGRPVCRLCIGSVMWPVFCLGVF